MTEWIGNSGVRCFDGSILSREEEVMDFIFEMILHAIVYVLKHILEDVFAYA
jgi:hypothetical protein